MVFLLFQCLLQSDPLMLKKIMRNMILLIKKYQVKKKEELLFLALWKLMSQKSSCEFFFQHYPCFMTYCLLLMSLVKRSQPTCLNWPPSLSPLSTDKISKEITRLTLLSNTHLLDVANNIYITCKDGPDFQTAILFRCSHLSILINLCTPMFLVCWILAYIVPIYNQRKVWKKSLI